MNPELAEDLLRTVMNGAADEHFPRQLGKLRDLATYKYDDYQQYQPGRQFIASLAGWLGQFEPGAERQNAFRFILQRLIYISDIEMRHLVSLMARDVVPATLQCEVANRLDIPSYQVSKVRSAPEFTRAMSSSLFLGMSDGARIDQFRRGNPDLSNEQFAMTHELNTSRAKTMREKLKSRLGDSSDFEYIFLVDDFSGSGKTILRQDEKGNPDGRFFRFIEDTLDLLCGDVRPKIILALYLATNQAVDYLEAEIGAYPVPPWTPSNEPKILTAMRLGDQAKLVCGRNGAGYETDLLFDQLLHKYYQTKKVEDEHKGNVLHGYSGCGLPLVLPHNTPNNSVYLLWEGKNTKALFPRFERHQSRMDAL